jgi:hypothetical protein
VTIGKRVGETQTLYGSVTAGVRIMTTTESAETLTLYQLTLLTGCFALLLPWGWVSPTPLDSAWILFNGTANAIGQYWWTRALHLAPASAVTPFYYFSLVWAIMIGFAATITRDNITFLSDCFVRADAQSSGVGRRLLHGSLFRGLPVRVRTFRRVNRPEIRHESQDLNVRIFVEACDARPRI